MESTHLQKLPTFKQWAGDRPVVPMGVSHDFIPGQGVVVLALHGTTRDFVSFDRSFSNSESDLGSGFYFSNNPDDICYNYSRLGPDLTNKIEHEIEILVDALFNDPGDGEEEENEDVHAMATRIVHQKHLENDGFTMPVFIRFENPVIIGGAHETFLDYEEIYNEELDEFEEPTGIIVKILDALRDIYYANERYNEFDPEKIVADLFESGSVEDGINVSDFITICTRSNGLAYAADLEDDAKLCGNEILRKAFEMVGFDGFIDLSVNSKFGDRRTSGKPMDGMDPDTIHFIAFHPNQIKSAIGNSGAFDPNSKDICDSHVAHAAEVADYYGARPVVTAPVQEIEMAPC